MHLLGRRLVLDQFQHPVAEHDRAFGGADVPAKLERLRVGQRRQEITPVRLDVANKVLKPFHKALALGLHRALQSVGVGGKEIGRRNHVHQLPREMFHPLAFVGLQPLKPGHGAVDRVDIAQILLLDEVEIGMAVPERVGKAPVLRRGVGRHVLETAAHGFLDIGEMAQRLAPIGRLLFDQLGGVVGGFLPESGQRARVKRVARRLHRRVGRTPVREGIDQPLGQIFHPRDIFVHFVLFRRAIFNFCCHRPISSLPYCIAA